MAIDHARLLARFLQEAREHCARINGGLVTLEQTPGDGEAMNEVYRSAHTIKGSARMLKLAPVAATAHRMEDLLDALKSGRVPFSRAASSLLFRGIDAVAGMLDRVAEGLPVPEPDESLCGELELAAAGSVDAAPDGTGASAAPGAAPDSPSAVPACDQRWPALDHDADRETGGRQRPLSGDTIRVSSEKLDGLIKLMGEVLADRGKLSGSLSRLGETLRLSRELCEPPAPGDDPATEGSVPVRTVRRLHDAVSEAFASMKDDILSQESLTRRLMESSLALRTLPLATIFDSLPRTVRDMAVALGKEVELSVEGGDTELDRLVIEKLGDPLLHMIRNAVDHGIESPDERRAAGKPETGSIRLSAWYEGGSVTVALRDDGRGISLEEIRARALQKRLADPEALRVMSDTELTDLIFMPGFSTSRIVTDLSGRGVGLDVVRKNVIEELRGSIRVDSRQGSGTAFYLRLPLNLALYRLLLISAAGRTFALPADCVEEVVSVAREELITVVSRKALRLRNEVIPVEGLAVLLGLAGGAATGEDRLLIAVVAVGSEKLGLVIDAVVDEESAVVKPLPPHLRRIRTVSGVTVRGRRDIVAVLGASALCAASRERKGIRPQQQAGEPGRELRVLVVDDSISTREIEKSIIEAHGYQVTVAGDGLEALEKARERSFDVVVTDIEMPRLDGFSLTERLRADERYRHTPIIIVTSREREEDRRRGILVGANAYIVKGSFDQSNLIETIENLVA